MKAAQLLCLALVLGSAFLVHVRAEEDLGPAPDRSAARSEDDGEDGEFYWYNEVTGKSQWEDPSLILHTEEGEEFYVNPATKETTWDRPVEAGWTVHFDEETGKEYYVNEVSEETTWEMPEWLAWRKQPAGNDEL